MSRVTVIPAVERTKVVRTEAPKVAVELTPTEAYHLYALLSAGVTCRSLKDVGLVSLHAGLERQLFGDMPCAVAPKWRASDVVGGACTPLNLYKTNDPVIVGRLRELEKVDA